ncbi:MAG: YeeE/YedE thiosulfate transporter family protein [Bacillota bacterium]|nr:YeeE/YedE thiosulfate transporter family protein [Bacillota bacterium]MDW7682845.1 YeeE/YedE thiosulfate transporter family protein [Bacillota bacterium]
MEKNWSWVKGGIILGILNTFVFFLAERLGTSGAYTKSVAKLTDMFSPDLANATFLSQPGGCTVGPADVALLGDLRIDWQWMAVIGIFIGAYLAARLSGRKQGPSLPEMWRANFGNNHRVRYLQGFIGGILLLLGARLAGGCTSGHVISGTSRLAVSGLVFGLAAFATGIPTALIIYRQRRV